MKKLVVVLLAVLVIGSITGCTREITHTSYTGTMEMENPQTGEIEWVEH